MNNDNEEVDQLTAIYTAEALSEAVWDRVEEKPNSFDQKAMDDLDLVAKKIETGEVDPEEGLSEARSIFEVWEEDRSDC